MNLYGTPEPHLVPGYDGHCPQYQYYVGGTYGQLTHKSFLNPCVPHGKDINLTVIHRTREIELPSKSEKKVLEERQKFVDAVYQDPIIPGYTGCVPRLTEQFGKRFLVAATSALVEHEALMERKRCEHRNLVHRNLLQGSQGLFDAQMNERLMARTKYHAPLIPINKRRQAIKVADEACVSLKETIPYSKDTTPHFMDEDDKEKWIINGYFGHIPRARNLFGTASKSLTRTALNEFSDDMKYRRYQKFCEPSEMDCKTAKCPPEPDCDIYHCHSGLIPKYAGHVPGSIFKIGKRSAVESIDAKGWLRLHKLQRNRENIPPACGEQCRRV